jgi:GTPase
MPARSFVPADASATSPPLPPSGTALLVGPPGDSLLELTRLVQGLGLRAVHAALGKRNRSGAVLGTGQLEAVRARLGQVPPDPEGLPPLVVVDGPLRPGELHRLQAALEAPVADRTDIILRVFALRARTPTARLEVELARLRYELPRVREDDTRSGREGGGGGRGERGHTNVELRKQELRAQIARSSRELESLRALEERQRERRAGAPRVALVGYTNAGKSSLLRALTGSAVEVKDELFVTLGTTVRALQPTTAPRILVSDTVGFIQNLPHEVVASFHTTLEEAREADLLLYVVDAADERWREQLQVVRETLASVAAGAVPAIVLLNKIDRVDAATREALGAELPEAVPISALDPGDAGSLQARIVGFFEARMLDDVLRVPPARMAMLGEIHGQARVLAEAHDQEGAELRVRAFPDSLQRWRRALGSPAVETAADVVALARRHGIEVGDQPPELDGSGLDFRVVHARDREDRPWVLRTPRRPEVVESAQVEGRVLRLVGPRLPVPVPDWRVHAIDLIAYPRLPGKPAVALDAAGAPAWSIDPQAPPAALLDALARAMAALQAVPLEAVRNAGVRVKDLAEVRGEYRQAMEETRAALQPPEPLWERWQRWLASEEGWPPHLALVHGDLHPGHWLLARERSEGGEGSERGEVSLVGILDWTEAVVTDPSVDLAMMFGSFGPAVFARLLERFERAGGRTWPGLAHHTAERWVAFPALIALWGQRAGNEGVIAHARSMMAG